MPIVYYNMPGRDRDRLTRDQIAELAEIPGIEYLKDTSGDAVDPDRAVVTAHATSIKAFNGWDTLTFFGIAAGAEGSVWGAAGVVPELAVEFWDTLAVKGDLIAGPRAVEAPVGDQRLPGVGRLRRRHQGRPGTASGTRRTRPAADPAAARPRARAVRAHPRGRGQLPS